MRWKLYWAALTSLVISAAAIHNWKKYEDRSGLWIAGKSLSDAGLSAGLCLVFPPLLIAFTVKWILGFVKQDSIWQTVAGVLSGTGLALVSTYALEVLAVLGVFASDIVTEKIFEEAQLTYRSCYEVGLQDAGLKR